MYARAGSTGREIQMMNRCCQLHDHWQSILPFIMFLRGIHTIRSAPVVLFNSSVTWLLSDCTYIKLYAKLLTSVLFLLFFCRKIGSVNTETWAVRYLRCFLSSFGLSLRFDCDDDHVAYVENILTSDCVTLACWSGSSSLVTCPQLNFIITAVLIASSLC